MSTSLVRKMLNRFIWNQTMPRLLGFQGTLFSYVDPYDVSFDGYRMDDADTVNELVRRCTWTADDILEQREVWLAACNAFKDQTSSKYRIVELAWMAAAATEAPPYYSYSTTSTVTLNPNPVPGSGDYTRTTTFEVTSKSVIDNTIYAFHAERCAIFDGVINAATVFSAVRGVYDLAGEIINDEQAPGYLYQSYLAWVDIQQELIDVLGFPQLLLSKGSTLYASHLNDRQYVADQHLYPENRYYFNTTNTAVSGYLYASYSLGDLVRSEDISDGLIRVVVGDLNTYHARDPFIGPSGLVVDLSSDKIQEVLDATGYGGVYLLIQTVSATSLVPVVSVKAVSAGYAEIVVSEMPSITIAGSHVALLVQLSEQYTGGNVIGPNGKNGIGIGPDSVGSINFAYMYQSNLELVAAVGDGFVGNFPGGFVDTSAIDVPLATPGAVDTFYNIFEVLSRSHAWLNQIIPNTPSMLDMRDWYMYQATITQGTFSFMRMQGTADMANLRDLVRLRGTTSPGMYNPVMHLYWMGGNKFSWYDKYRAAVNEACTEKGKLLDLYAYDYNGEPANILSVGPNTIVYESGGHRYSKTLLTSTAASDVDDQATILPHGAFAVLGTFFNFGSYLTRVVLDHDLGIIGQNTGATSAISEDFSTGPSAVVDAVGPFEYGGFKRTPLVLSGSVPFSVSHQLGNVTFGVSADNVGATMTYLMGLERNANSNIFDTNFAFGTSEFLSVGVYAETVQTFVGFVEQTEQSWTNFEGDWIQGIDTTYIVCSHPMNRLVGANAIMIVGSVKDTDIKSLASGPFTGTLTDIGKVETVEMGIPTRVFYQPKPERAGQQYYTDNSDSSKNFHNIQSTDLVGSNSVWLYRERDEPLEEVFVDTGPNTRPYNLPITSSPIKHKAHVKTESAAIQKSAPVLVPDAGRCYGITQHSSARGSGGLFPMCLRVSTVTQFYTPPEGLREDRNIQNYLNYEMNAVDVGEVKKVIGAYGPLARCYNMRSENGVVGGSAGAFTYTAVKPGLDVIIGIPQDEDAPIVCIHVFIMPDNGYWAVEVIGASFSNAGLLGVLSMSLVHISWSMMHAGNLQLTTQTNTAARTVTQTLTATRMANPFTKVRVNDYSKHVDFVQTDLDDLIQGNLPRGNSIKRLELTGDVEDCPLVLLFEQNYSNVQSGCRFYGKHKFYRPVIVDGKMVFNIPQSDVIAQNQLPTGVTARFTLVDSRYMLRVRPLREYTSTTITSPFL